MVRTLSMGCKGLGRVGYATQEESDFADGH